MTKFPFRLPVCLLSLLIIASPVYGDPNKDKPGKGKGLSERADKGWKKDQKKERKSDKHKERSDPQQNDWWRGVRSQVRDGRFDVPPGHRPPPGMCRIWYPGRPPGQQPPPEACGQLRRDRNSYILFGDRGYDSGYDWERTREDALRDIPHELLDILLDRMR